MKLWEALKPKNNEKHRVGERKEGREGWEK